MISMQRHGFVRAAVAIPRVAVADPRTNVDRMLELLAEAGERGCDLVVFPELSVTGYTCADLFHQSTLLSTAIDQLIRLAEASASVFPGLFLVGTPMRVADRAYNVAAVVSGGRVLGLVPKSHIPNYKEFYERRWFTPATGREPSSIRIAGQEIPFGVDLLFEATDFSEMVVGVELCEDLWVPIPPSCGQSLAGATLLTNLSASNAGTGKSVYRRELVTNQSARCVAGYAYSGAGVTESTTDLVFDGHGILAENGRVLAETERFERSSTLQIATIDIEGILADRMRMTSFGAQASGFDRDYRRIGFSLGPWREGGGFDRHVPAHPFVPADAAHLSDRCGEIFETQTAALAKRLESAQPEQVSIGVSGGIDSTLALLVAAKTCDLLGWDRSLIRGLTMPGFGTSEHTRQNAERLMRLLGVDADRIDIRASCLETFRILGHCPFGIDPSDLAVEEFQSALATLPAESREDLVFENVQARTRTMLLMSRGFVIGTGDLSELALGWSTYNGDQMSMYNPNAGIPKTLVRFLVRWAADHEFTGPSRAVLHSVADTEISPELLPIDADQGIQSTESTIGPFELHDFFLFHVLRYGFGPAKILWLAQHARFDRAYTEEELRGWMKLFLARFFRYQFKRSCLPDGPKIGSVSLSPRGDWRMPSDAEASAWESEITDGPEA